MDLDIIQYKQIPSNEDRFDIEMKTTLDNMVDSKSATKRPLTRDIRVRPAPKYQSSDPIQKPPKPAASQNYNDYHDLTKSAVAGNICQIFGVFFAIAVRVMLLSFCVLTVWLVVDKMQDNRYWGLLGLDLLLILEGVFTVVKRSGQERKWICLCFVCYLIGCIPSIWLLELERLNLFENKFSNASSGVSIGVSGLTAEFVLDSSLVLNVTEQGLLFLLILCRWLLPKGDITRDQLSQLLFVFIGMASDVMELFELFDTTQVRQDRNLTYIILAVWSVSLFQFCLVLTMSHNPKKARIAMDETEGDESAQNRERRAFKAKYSLLQRFLMNELWSLIVTMFMQDGPFLAVRLYVLVRHQVINYSIVFFTSKNVLVLLLLCYRFLVLCLEKFEDDDEDEINNRPANFKDSHEVLASNTIPRRNLLAAVRQAGAGQTASVPNTNNETEGSVPRGGREPAQRPGDGVHLITEDAQSRGMPSKWTTVHRAFIRPTFAFDDSKW